jgi:16S rRNA (guanine527-N7)-methyltransferase
MILANKRTERDYVAERTDEAGLAKLEQLIDALIDENSRQNLVASATLEHVWQRHIADSVQLLDHVPRETVPWLDLGTGAGFPGIVIAIVRPQTPVFLVESRNRRVAWLTEQVARLEMPNCTVLGSRLEAIETFPAGVISARAFAPLPRLMELSARFSTESTFWVLPKGRSAAQEVAELPDRLRSMFHVEQSLTDAEAGIIVGKGKIAGGPEARK